MKQKKSKLSRRAFLDAMGASVLGGVALTAGVANAAINDSDFDLDVRLDKPKPGGPRVAQDASVNSCAVSCGGSCETCGSTCSSTCGSSCGGTCNGTCVTCGGASCNASCQGDCPSPSSQCPPPPPGKNKF